MSSLSRSVSGAAEAAATERIEARSLNRILIAAGFAVGIIIGTIANFLPAGAAVDVAHGISSLGLILGGVLFAARLARQELDIAAAGVALFVLAQGVIVSAGTPTDPGGEAAFAGGAALYALALLLVGVQAALPTWTRIVGALAAVPFGVHGLMWWLGEAPESSGPFPGIGYMLLTIAVVGWIIAALRPTASE